MDHYDYGHQIITIISVIVTLCLDIHTGSEQLLACYAFCCSRGSSGNQGGFMIRSRNSVAGINSSNTIYYD